MTISEIESQLTPILYNMMSDLWNPVCMFSSKDHTSDLMYSTVWPVVTGTSSSDSPPDWYRWPAGAPPAHLQWNRHSMLAYVQLEKKTPPRGVTGYLWAQTPAVQAGPIAPLLWRRVVATCPVRRETEQDKRLASALVCLLTETLTF